MNEATVPDREDAPSTQTLLWRERLRADTAERELKRANRILARLGEIAEGWPEMFDPDEPLNARRVSDTILMTIRETP